MMTCGRRKVTGGPYTLTTDSILTVSSTNDFLRLTMIDMTRSSGHIISDVLPTDKTGFQNAQRNPASFKVILAVCKSILRNHDKQQCRSCEPLQQFLPGKNWTRVVQGPYHLVAFQHWS